MLPSPHSNTRPSPSSRGESRFQGEHTIAAVLAQHKFLIQYQELTSPMKLHLLIATDWNLPYLLLTVVAPSPHTTQPNGCQKPNLETSLQKVSVGCSLSICESSSWAGKSFAQYSSFEGEYRSTPTYHGIYLPADSPTGLLSTWSQITQAPSIWVPLHFSRAGVHPQMLLHIFWRAPYLGSIFSGARYVLGSTISGARRFRFHDFPVRVVGFYDGPHFVF